MMSDHEDAQFYRKREMQELESSRKASNTMIRRLHWEMAQRYAYLANECEARIDGMAEERRPMPSVPMQHPLT